MSYELLVRAGEPTPVAQAERRLVLSHAVRQVPNQVESVVVESPTAVAAVVATAPGGGTLARVGSVDGGQRLTIATAEHGLAAAQDGRQGCGAEAAHVTVLLRDDGGVVLSTDGVGFIPCYWGRPEGGLAVSTHLASLVSLGLSPAPDDQGVVEYVVTQSPIGARTLLREATMLVAGGSVRWGIGSWTAPRPASAFSPSGDRLSDREALDTFARVWPEILADAFRGDRRIALGLSGGLDSRAIAEGAVHGGFRPITFTYGGPPSRDPVVAGEVAGVLGLPHVRIPVAADRLLAGAVGALDLLDGAHSPSEMYELWFRDVVGDFADGVVNGNAGGPLWGDDKALGLAHPDAVVAQRMRSYAGALTGVLPYLAKGLRQEARTMLERGFVESLAEWDLETHPDHVIYWRVLNRQFRWGNMLTNALRRSGLRPEAPFLDSRFLTLASRFTGEQRRHGRLYLEVHRNLFARTAGIGRADDGNAPRALNHVYWSGDSPYLLQLAALARSHPLSAARRAIRQAGHETAATLQKRIGLAGPARRDTAYRSVFTADTWLREEPVYARRLRELLEVGEHPLFAEDAVGAAIENIARGRRDVPALVLGKVAAARAWLSDYERRARELDRVRLLRTERSVDVRLG